MVCSKSPLALGCFIPVDGQRLDQLKNQFWLASSPYLNYTPPLVFLIFRLVKVEALLPAPPKTEVFGLLGFPLKMLSFWIGTAFPF
jgi:hypothetical protein